jgi:hypothetical protein
MKGPSTSLGLNGLGQFRSRRAASRRSSLGERETVFDSLRGGSHLR